MKTIIGLFGVINILSLTDAYGNPSESGPTIICPCRYKYDPVCGSDGITYMNKCVLDCTSRTIERQGQPSIKIVVESACNDDCRCQNVDLPVCTIDGKTYPNECVLACENIERIANKQPLIYLAYRTACRGSPGDCTDIAAPVCGSDNILYRNRCVLDYRNTYNLELGVPPITVKNNGGCQDGYLCPITKQPVCASDGNVYKNSCELEAENERRKGFEETIFLTEAHPSECSDCPCPNDDEPVCASNGNTYTNRCELDCVIQKQNNNNLRVVYNGKCRECDCKEEHRPVCGTNRKTYDSICLLECENIGRDEDMPTLTVFHEGECQQLACDCSYCDENYYQPTCGTDDYTYWNVCWLQCNDRCCQKNGQGNVRVAKSGPC